MKTETKPLLVILGPTASGKTALSLNIGQAIPAEIISSDSRLLYRGMDIGTAKPTLEERRIVPHHLIDIANPQDAWSLARYLREAGRVIGDVHGRGRLPVLVGGTGQYLRAIVDGWSPPPRPENDLYRNELEEFAAHYGASALHGRLAELDPDSAKSIDYRNIRRVIRALEIIHTTGEPASQARKKVPQPYQVMKVGVQWPREALYRRIDERIDQMLADGWLDEVQALLDAGIDLDSPAMSAIGYRQLVRTIRKLSRQFVRRQANWFKLDDPSIRWYDPGGNTAREVIRDVEKWLIGLRDQGGHAARDLR
jgi:tRNA dimethylallyltransferase